MDRFLSFLEPQRIGLGTACIPGCRVVGVLVFVAGLVAELDACNGARSGQVLALPEAAAWTELGCPGAKCLCLCRGGEGAVEAGEQERPDACLGRRFDS